MAAVRAPFSGGVRWELDPPQSDGSDRTPERPKAPRQKSDHGEGRSGRIQRNPDDTASAAALHAASEKGSMVELDTALVVSPLGRAATKAVYWIHPDHLVEIHILLLQHTRLRNPVTSPISASSASSPNHSRKGSMNGRGVAQTFRPDDGIGIIVCDDLQRFAKRWSAATIGDSEDRAGDAGENDAVMVTYTSSGEAIVTIGLSAKEVCRSPDLDENRDIIKAKLKRKNLRDLFDFSLGDTLTRSESRKSINTNSADGSEGKHDLAQARAWLAAHREVQPLVHLQMTRTRFVGLGNNETKGVWVMLDTNILMQQCTLDNIEGKGDLLTLGEGTGLNPIKFPHAILTVRVEGDDTPKLVAALDESHLASGSEKRNSLRSS